MENINLDSLPAEAAESLRALMEGLTQQLASANQATSVANARAIHAENQSQFYQSQAQAASANLASSITQAFSNLPTPIINIPATPTIPHPTPQREVKGVDPAPFTGDRSKTEEFIRLVKLQVALHSTSMSTDVAKIIYTLTLIHGGTAEAC